VRDGEVLAETSENSAKGHAGALPRLVGRALETAAVALARVEVLAVSLGPGSFTGLRVGLSFAKGMAFASGARMVGVSTLEALASVTPAHFGLVAVACDARRGETYTAAFRRRAGGLERIAEDAVRSPEEAVAWVGAQVEVGTSAILVGDASERYPQCFEPLRGRLTIADFAQCHPSGSVVALLGERRLRGGQCDRVEALVPCYVRASSAERTLQKATLTMQNVVS
jgi:tRNA threonylcarbamoyladenosine biosynthesis protein TsaB